MTFKKVNSLELEIRSKHFFVASSTTSLKHNQTNNISNQQKTTKQTVM